MSGAALKEYVADLEKQVQAFYDKHHVAADDADNEVVAEAASDERESDLARANALAAADAEW